jgi:hypothetical protein
MSKQLAITNAISAHGAWIGRFRRFFSGQEKLDAAVVSKNDQCDFGKWLNGEGKGLLDGASYQQIHKLHTEFHKIAGEVVRKVERGDVAGGKAAIEKTGEFGKASAVLTAAMMAARDKAA